MLRGDVCYGALLWPRDVNLFRAPPKDEIIASQRRTVMLCDNEAY